MLHFLLIPQPQERRESYVAIGKLRTESLGLQKGQSWVAGMGVNSSHYNCSSLVCYKAIHQYPGARLAEFPPFSVLLENWAHTYAHRNL